MRKGNQVKENKENVCPEQVKTGSLPVLSLSRPALQLGKVVIPPQSS